MSVALPDGSTWRRPPTADGEAIWSFVGANNTAIIGFADCTLDDVNDELEDPGFDVTRDGWIVHDRAGAIAGYGWVARKGGSAEIDVDVTAAHDGCRRLALGEVIARAGGIAVVLGNDQFVADEGCGTILHVDTNNPTPALGLYERVGMRPVLVIDVWNRSLTASDATSGR